MAGPARKFGPYTLGIFSVIMLSVWTFAAGSLGIGIYGGGAPVLIYGTLAIGTACSIFTLLLAELASAYPQKAGIVYAATKIAGPGWGHMVGYFTGSFITIGSLFTPVALLIVTAQLLASVGVAIRPTWVPERWQIFLILQGVNMVTAFCVLYLTRIVHVLSTGGGCILFVTLFVVVGLLVGFSDANNSVEFVWSETVNGTGWPNCIGILIGLTGPAYAYGPVHWLMNMAEDVREPQRSVPIGMIIQQVGNILSLLAFYIAASYTVTDWTSLLETTFPSPVAALFQQVTSSKGAVIGLLLTMLIPGLIGNISYIAATLRLIHGFAETGALPFQKWMTKWDQREETPVNILLVECGITFIMGCVYLGSHIGFTVIMSSCYVFLQLGYITLLFGYVYGNRRYLTSDRWLHLPHTLATSLAVFSLAYQIFILVLYLLPPQYPVNSENMNWGVIFAIGGTLLVGATWRIRKHKFVGFLEETPAAAGLGSIQTNTHDAKHFDAKTSVMR